MYKQGALIAAILLVIALAPMPYGYYQVLRIVVCGLSCYGAYLAYNAESHIWMWLLAGIAILFNPIFPIYLERDLWNVIDLVTAATLFLSTRSISEDIPQ